ncbi:MAG: hypothetical protein MZW92_42865 [Comamonadaceae bacterium]|nr:hypothetical protein [Comamonadaceae bacterium]
MKKIADTQAVIDSGGGLHHQRQLQGLSRTLWQLMEDATDQLGTHQGRQGQA